MEIGLSIARFLDWMRDSRLRPGFDAILLPGERAHRAEREAEAHGVPVEERMVKMLDEVAAKHGIEPLARSQSGDEDG